MLQSVNKGMKRWEFLCAFSFPGHLGSTSPRRPLQRGTEQEEAGANERFSLVKGWEVFVSLRKMLGAFLASCLGRAPAEARGNEARLLDFGITSLGN